jgi:hypothetical protein
MYYSTYSSSLEVLQSVAWVIAIGGGVLSLLVAIGVLRTWHHTAAMRRVLEQIAGEEKVKAAEESYQRPPSTF